MRKYLPEGAEKIARYSFLEIQPDISFLKKISIAKFCNQNLLKKKKVRKMKLSQLYLKAEENLTKNYLCKKKLKPNLFLLYVAFWQQAEHHRRLPNFWLI